MHEQDGYKHLQVKDSARDLSPTAQEALVFVVVAPRHFWDESFQIAYFSVIRFGD